MRRIHSFARATLLIAMLQACESTVRPPVPTDIAVNAGNLQTGNVGSALQDSVAVLVTDDRGAPMSGATVAWSVMTGGGTISPASSRTNASGVARASWTLGLRLDLTHALSATVAALVPAQFTAAPQLPTSASVEKVSGDAQQRPVTVALQDSLAIAVKLADGRPVQGASIAWSTTGPGATLNPTSQVTNASGVAKTQWTLGTVAGGTTAMASIPGIPAATFTAIAEPGPTDTLTITPAENPLLVGAVSQLTARAVDRFGNVITGRPQSWISTVPGVATVSTSGLVSANEAGRTTIIGGIDSRTATALVRVIALSGRGTPVLNGTLAQSEWSGAATFDFDVNVPGGGTTPARLYVMNDDTNLYFAVRVTRSVTDAYMGVVFLFDNNANGLFSDEPFEEGDDAFGFTTQNGFIDNYYTLRPPCPSGQICGFSDVDDGGTVDGAGAFGSAGTDRIFELSHPLNSTDDAHDLSRTLNQSVGMIVSVSILAQNANVGSDTPYPSGTHLYLRLRPAP